MGDFVAVAALAEVPEDGRLRVFDAGGGREVALSRHGGRVIATSPWCPHQRARLDEEGEIEGGELICFRHGWTFDLGTGACDVEPAKPLTVYPTRVEGERVWVDLTLYQPPIY